MASEKNLSVVIDIGTSKMVGLVGSRTNEGKIEIAGMATVVSGGIKRGVVFNIDEVATGVRKLLDDLETQIEAEITGVTICYAGQHFKSISVQSSVISANGEITQEMVDQLFAEARNYHLPEEDTILHVIPQKYLIDNENLVSSPVGISGEKLDARFKLLVVPKKQIDDFEKVFSRVGVNIEKITYSPLAISEAVLTSVEKEVGSIILDIGAGTTKIAVYKDNILQHVAVIPFGGMVVTKDIKEGCSILEKWAEKLKITYGHALGDFADEQSVVTIPGYNGWEPKEISFKSLAFIIQARLEEIMDSVNYQIEKSEVDQIGTGVVITGGTSNMKNIDSLVKYRTCLDARIAFSVINPVNHKAELQNEKYLTALGLLKLTLKGETKPQKAKTSRSIWGGKFGGFTPKLNKVLQGVINFVDEDDLEMK